MKTQVRYKSFDQISFTDSLVYSKLPKHSFWSNIHEQIDFSFADSLCAFLYTGRGQRPYAPSLKLKIHLVQVYYRLSDRQTEEKIIGDLFVKRFLSLPVEFFGFDHSTIGLDRQRMGVELFRACHLYILAQMYRLGLWGDHDESWIIDSFPCHSAIVLAGTRRLIQQASIRVLQHLKRTFPELYRHAQQSLLLDSFTARLSPQAPTKEQLLAFSKLVAQAHALLDWFVTPDVVNGFERLNKPAPQRRSQELQEVLRRILSENSRPFNPKDDASTSIPLESDASSDTAECPVAPNPDAQAVNAEEEAIQYERIPRSERPSDRIVSTCDPDARVGMKTKRQRIEGYKIQNLCTSGGVVLELKVIPAYEHDREATFSMVKGMQDMTKITPRALLGDTCYGHGSQRQLLESIGVQIVAPVPTSSNSKGLYDNSHFQYDPENHAYRCPAGNTSLRTSYSKKLSGTQHHFGKQCHDCPLRQQCTTSASGRSVFHSDYFEMYKQAQAVNESDEGQALLRQRCRVEQKNAELKNDCGLGMPRTRSQKALGIKAYLAAMVVNLKLTVRRLCAPKTGFIRRTRTA